MPKPEVLATIDCPKCKTKIDILKQREVLEVAIPAVVEINYSARLSNQTKLG
jgi:DnaJ-class molecular chaperone